MVLEGALKRPWFTSWNRKWTHAYEGKTTGVFGKLQDCGEPCKHRRRLSPGFWGVKRSSIFAERSKKCAL